MRLQCYVRYNKLAVSLHRATKVQCELKVTKLEPWQLQTSLNTNGTGA